MALEKHGETRQKREWRKLHIAVDHHHIIQTNELTDKKAHDMEVVDDLITPIFNNVNQVTADTAYDANKRECSSNCVSINYLSSRFKRPSK